MSLTQSEGQRQGEEHPVGRAAAGSVAEFFRSPSHAADPQPGQTPAPGSSAVPTPPPPAWPPCTVAAAQAGDKLGSAGYEGKAMRYSRSALPPADSEPLLRSHGPLSPR